MFPLLIINKFHPQVLTEGPETSAVSHPPTNPGFSNYAGEQRPYETTLRQESYITDTDRSFPLAGGVKSSSSENPTHASHAREGLAGVAAATAIGASHTMSKPEKKDIQNQAAETRQATYGDMPSTTVRSSTQLFSSVRMYLTENN